MYVGENLLICLNNTLFYTTRRIYNYKISCYVDNVKREKRNETGSRKEKDMTTMNRLYSFYRESYEAGCYDERKLSFSFMYPFIDKCKRENCVIDIKL